MAAHPDQTILKIVDATTTRLRSMTDNVAATKPGPNRWCKKEILGHLIDSASNNHQRFVRVLLAGELQFPGYTQDAWVNTQQYAQEDWQSLIDLWAALNRHLAHIISRMPADKMDSPCRIGEREAIPLADLIHDYIKHMEHHIKQLLISRHDSAELTITSNYWL
jgi:hypothetical protein